MKLRGGFSLSIRRTNLCTCSRPPSSSTKTPSAELLTQPESPSSVASRYTHGRKPTPCTAPQIVSRARARSFVLIGFRKEFDQFQVVRFIDFLRRPAPWADKHMTDEVVARNTGVLMHGFAPGYCEGERFAREH